MNLNLNASYPGGGAAGRALYQKWGRATTISQITPFRAVRYDSLQSQLTRRMSGGSLFGLSYTFSKAINYTGAGDGGVTWNWVEMLGRNRATSEFDRTHNLQIYGVYELPFGRGKTYATNGVAAALAGGWQVNGLMSYMSGTPFSVGTSSASLNAPGNSQTADQVLSDVAILGGHGRGESYFNPYAFATVTDVRFGASGRNILRGPGLLNLDASVFRTFDLTERFHVQFRAEALSATNTPQFSNPGATVSSATRNSDGTIKALNGYTEILSAGGARQWRLALKFYF